MAVVFTKVKMLYFFGDYDPWLGRGYDIPVLVKSLIEANEKKRGMVTCTKDDRGCIVAVTRTNDEHQVLEVIAEGKSFEKIKREICS